MHPRLCVSGISSWNQTVAEDIALYADLGVHTFGLALRKVQTADDLDLVESSGLTVGNVIGVGRDGVGAAIPIAHRFGDVPIVFTTGPAAGLEWEEAAAAFTRALEPLPRALLTLEHTNSLRPDVSFVHTLRDAIDLARALDIHVCMEINACWGERGLDRTIRDGIDRIAVVQVSDYAVGTLSTPNRLVPGDGDIPLERIIGTVLDAGYVGLFDIELVGPQIEAEGYRSAIARSVEWLSTLLIRLGV